MSAPIAVIDHRTIPFAIRSILKSLENIVKDDFDEEDLPNAIIRIRKLINNICVLDESANNLKLIPDYVKNALPALDTLAQTARRIEGIIDYADTIRTKVLMQNFLIQIKSVSDLFPVSGKISVIPTLSKTPFLIAVK